MRYINCARKEDEQSVCAFQYKKDIYYKTFRTIPAGEELLIWYGANYARYLHLSVKGKYMLQKGNYGPGKGDVFVSHSMFRISQSVHENKVLTNSESTPDFTTCYSKFALHLANTANLKIHWSINWRLSVMQSTEQTEILNFGKGGSHLEFLMETFDLDLSTYHPPPHSF